MKGSAIIGSLAGLAAVLAVWGCATGGPKSAFFNSEISALTVAAGDAYERVRIVRSDSTRNVAGFTDCMMKYGFAKRAVDRYVDQMVLDVDTRAAPDSTVYRVLANGVERAVTGFTDATDNYGTRFHGIPEIVLKADSLLRTLRERLWPSKEEVNARYEHLKRRLELARWKEFYEI